MSTPRIPLATYMDLPLHVLDEVYRRGVRDGTAAAQRLLVLPARLPDHMPDRPTAPPIVQRLHSRDLHALFADGRERNARQIMRAFPTKSRNAVYAALYRLAKAGYLVRVESGWYKAAHTHE